MSYTYYSNGKIQSSLRFEGNKEIGFKSIFDSLGHLIYKSNFFYGKEIGDVYAYDTFNTVTEYSFNNFEDDILYYSRYDPNSKKHSYPGDGYLIKATTTMVSVNGNDGTNVFLYLFRPPKLRLNYSIAYFNQRDSPLYIFPIVHSSFFYQGFFERKTENLKLGILVNKYDSFSKKEEVIIQYLKTSYP